MLNGRLCLQIWRVEDWELVNSTGKPFRKGFIPMVFTLRLGWSPDGQTLAVVNAFDPPNHVVPLLERQTWDGDVNLIGHTGESLSGSICCMACSRHSDSSLRHALRRAGNPGLLMLAPPEDGRPGSVRAWASHS